MPQDANGVIEFVHTGDDSHRGNPLYISAKKFDIHLDAQQKADLQHIIGKNIKITPEKVRLYVEVSFDTIVTDKKTFLSVRKFVFANKNYYTNDYQDDNPMAPSYGIFVNGSKFFIYYKLKRNFFDDLNAYLKKGHCDQRVIKAFSQSGASIGAGK